MIQHALAPLDAVTLHCAWRGNGRPILFLHGFPAFWAVWQRQLEQFGDDFYAIAVDGRGVNRSSKPTDLSAYKIEYLAADVAQLIRYLCLDEVILVGHDWGGALAWEVAKRYPQLLSHLIVANAPPLDALLFALATMDAQREASEYINRLKAPTAEARLSANGCELLWASSFGPLVATDIYGEEERTLYQQCWQRPGSLTGFLNWYRANVPDFDEIDAKTYQPQPQNQIVTPTLLLWGEHERAFIRPLLNLIPQYAPNMQLEIVPNANHWLFLEQPDVAYRLVREFVGVDNR